MEQMREAVTALERQVAAQAEVVKQQKAAAPGDKAAWQPAVDALLALKKDLTAAQKKLADSLAESSGAAAAPAFDRAALESMLFSRFFFAPAFGIYGGVRGLYDYGPPGTSLQTNILHIWRQHFVLEEDMLEIDTTNLTPAEVLKTSGHVERFADYMVKDPSNGVIYRADHLVKDVLKARLDGHQLALQAKLAPVAPAKKGGAKGDAAKPPPQELNAETIARYETILDTLDNYVGDALTKLMADENICALDTNVRVTDPELFNLMFSTQIGPTGNNVGYLRPETAQGHFLNFKNLYQYNQESMPFASASIGRSFRNEISPRQGLLRVREFTMAEIEHFVDPLKKDHPRFHEVADLSLPLWSADAQMNGQPIVQCTVRDAVALGLINNQTLAYFVARIYLFLVKIGIDPQRIRMRQHMANEMAHYAQGCWDAEIQSSYGWIECVGCADRSAYDLSAHSARTKERLVAREMLAEPIVKTAWMMDINKAKLGPAFKGDAKHVLAYFEGLKSCTSGEWDEAALLRLKAQLDADHQAEIVAPNGKTYTVTEAMIAVRQETTKVTGVATE